MAQLAKETADNLSLISRTHMVEGEISSCKLSSDFHILIHTCIHTCMHIYTCMRTYTYTYVNVKIIEKQNPLWHLQLCG